MGVWVGVFVDAWVGGCGVGMWVGVYLHVFLCLFSVYCAGSKGSRSVKLFLANNCTTSPCGIQRLHMPLLRWNLYVFFL